MYVCATGDGEARSACLLNGSANTSDSQRRRGDHILGNGVFTESVFSNSWECDVAEKSYYYWLERYYIEEHPLFAFEVEFHDAPFPPQEPLPELHWSDLFDFVFDIEQLTASAAAQLPPPVADVEREWRRELALSPKGLHWAASGARSAKFASDSSVVVPPSLEKAHWVDESGGLAVRTEDGSLCRWTWDAGLSAMVVTATSVGRVELLDVSANGTVALVRRPSGEVEAWSADSLSPLRQVRASSEEGCSRYHCSMTPQLQQVRISRFQARASRSSSWRLGAA